MTVADITAEIIDTLNLGIPLHRTVESGPYLPGINVWRLTRPDVPTRTHPYRGTLVTVMYAPQTDSEARHDEWAARVRDALLTAYPDRYRPLPTAGSSSVLIEDPDTAYVKWRAAENATRASLGWAPLHEIGK